MTTLKEALHDYLREQIDVSVHEGRLPTRPLWPAVVQHYVAGSTLQTHSSPASLLPRRVQLDAYAQNEPECDDIATRIVRALDGFHGAMGSVAIGWAALLNSIDSAPVELKGGGIAFRSVLDFEIAHQRLEGSS
jgi:hypothetical protein